MKKIKYELLAGEEVSNENLQKVIPYSLENEEIAKMEAYNGEYTIFDDGESEAETPKSDKERIAELEEALRLLLEGATE